MSSQGNLAEPLPRGSTLGGYRIEELIGRDRFGDVYRATQLALQRPVRLALVDPERASDPTSSARLREAARLAAGLDHPNVVPVHEVAEVDGRLLVASAYPDDEDLGTLLAREGTVEPRRAALLVADAAEAIDAAHRRGLVHGHIAASSILVHAENGGDRALVTGFALPPESADRDTDIRALAELLAASLTGGAAASEVSESAPRELRVVLRRALATDVKSRYRSAGDFARALRAAVEEQGRRPRRRVRALALAGLAGLLLAGAVLAILGVIGVFSDEGASPTTTAKPSVPAAALGKAIELPSPPGEMTVGEGFVWIASFEHGTLTRVDPRANEVLGLPARLAGFAGGLATGEGAVWVGTEDGVVRVDADTLEVGEPIEVGGGAISLAVGEGAVWALVPISRGDAPPSRLDLVHIDPTKRRADPRPLSLGDPGEQPEANVIAAEGSVWVAVSNRGEILRVSPTGRGVLQRMDLGGHPTALTAAAGAIWVADPSGARLTRIDAESGRVIGDPVILREGALRLGFDGQTLWLLADSTIRRIDPSSGQVLGGSFLVPGLEPNPARLAGGAEGVWLFTSADQTLARVMRTAVSPPRDPTAVFDLSGQGPWELLDRGALPPGRYRSTLFSIPLRFRVSEGWETAIPQSERGIALQESEGPGTLGFLVPATVFSPDASRELPPPQDLVAWLQDHPHLETTEAKPIAIGGQPGRQLDVRVGSIPKPNPPECESQDVECVMLFRVGEGFEYVVFPGWRQRFAVLEVEGQMLLIIYESPTEMFERFVPTAEKVLRTIRFE